jgi:hypothetical protein
VAHFQVSNAVDWGADDFPFILLRVLVPDERVVAGIGQSCVEVVVVEAVDNVVEQRVVCTSFLSDLNVCRNRNVT